jgi:hypothetical protein
MPARRVTLAPHLPPEWDSVGVDHVPVGRGSMSFTVRRAGGAVTAVVRRSGADRSPIEIVFSPALPLGARSLAAATSVETTPGDLHGSVRATFTDSVVLRIPFTGGWNIVPPAMPAVLGSRSRAPRVLSERIGRTASGAERYVVALEGRAGQRYAFRVRAPDESTAAALAVESGDGAKATIAPMRAPGTERVLEVTFPATGANADGYSTATLTFERASRP